MWERGVMFSQLTLLEEFGEDVLLLLRGLHLRRQTLSRRRLQAIYGNIVKRNPSAAFTDKRADDSNKDEACGPGEGLQGERGGGIPLRSRLKSCSRLISASILFLMVFSRASLLAEPFISVSYASEIRWISSSN